MATNSNQLDPNKWEGDPDELVGHVDELTLDIDGDITTRLFSSKHEAFLAGLHVGSSGGRQRVEKNSV